MNGIQRKFAQMGARVAVRENAAANARARLDVARDKHGEYFDLAVADPDALSVVDVDAAGRHLLLLLRDGPAKSKFLCGHDERHWFVAAIPESARGVGTVRTAKRALQPEDVRAAVRRARPKDEFRRRNTAYVRQGEWFFVPQPDLDVPAQLVLRNEPLSRGVGSKPHMLELAYRRGGQRVYVSRLAPGGISEAAYEALPADEQRGSWRLMVRDATVFAKGAVRHSDHATVVLDYWHRVDMNTERRAAAMQHVVFLD